MDKGTEKQVEHEQEAMRQKSREVAGAVKNLANGEVKHMPTTERVERAIIHGEQTIESLQESERGQQLGGKGQQETEQEARKIGKSILALAAEKATQYLDSQQTKIQRKRSEHVRISHQRGPASSPSPTHISTPVTTATDTTNTPVATTTSPTPSYNLNGRPLHLSLDSNLDSPASLSASLAIPPTPPSSPINPAYATLTHNPTLADSSFIPESLCDVPASMRAEEIHNEMTSSYTDLASIREEIQDKMASSSADLAPIPEESSDDIVYDVIPTIEITPPEDEEMAPVDDAYRGVGGVEELTHPNHAPAEAWVPAHVMPPLGFEVYPDVPSISGGSSEDVASNASVNGDEDVGVSMTKSMQDVDKIQDKLVNATPHHYVNQQGTSAF